MVYLLTFTYHKKSTIHVGKYTSPMDPMGQYLPFPPSMFWQIAPQESGLGTAQGASLETTVPALVMKDEM